MSFDNWRKYDDLHLDPVLNAAVGAFNETGYHGASVRDIARRAGLSVPGMYHHFASKQDMLVGILNLTMEDLLARSRAAKDEAGDDPVRSFALLVENLVLFHCHRRDLAFIGGSEMRSLVANNRQRIAAMRTAQQRMVDLEVEAASAAGLFHVEHTRDASRAVVTMCVAVPTWYRFDDEETPEQLAEQYVDFGLGLMRYSGVRPR